MPRKRKFARQKFRRSLIVTAMISAGLLILTILTKISNPYAFVPMLMPFTPILLLAGFASFLMGVGVDLRMLARTIKSAGVIQDENQLLDEIEKRSRGDFELMMTWRQHVWVFSLFYIPAAFIAIGTGWDWYYWQPVGLVAYYAGIYLVLSVLFLLEPYWRYRTLSTLFAAIATHKKGNPQRVYQGWFAFIAATLLLAHLSFRIGFSMLMIPGSFGDSGGWLMRYVYNLPSLSNMEWSQQMLIASSVGAVAFILLPVFMRGMYFAIEKIAYRSLTKNLEQEEQSTEHLEIQGDEQNYIIMNEEAPLLQNTKTP